jgi:hypothetical protein
VVAEGSPSGAPPTAGSDHVEKKTVPVDGADVASNSNFTQWQATEIVEHVPGFDPRGGAVMVQVFVRNS